MQKLDFEFWKAISEIFCALLLVFSFVGEDKLFGWFTPLLIVDIALILFCIINMVLIKRKA